MGALKACAALRTLTILFPLTLSVQAAEPQKPSKQEDSEEELVKQTQTPWLISSAADLFLRCKNRLEIGSMRYIVITVCLLLSDGVSFGQYIYPAKGQSAQQQEKDKYECYVWAKNQTGFDPASPQYAQAPAPSGPQPGGEIVRGTARGALVGTVGGAIAGSAGTGAAAGAAMGGLVGGMRKMDKAKTQQQQAQQQNYNAQARAAYDRALSACLEGRGYTVR
jgi:hypothetical protein